MLKGVVTLPVTTAKKLLEVDFMVVDADAAYSAILGKSWMYRMEGVASSLY